MPFRLSGLINGSKLDLVVKSSSPTPIDVALQLPEIRVESKFSSATTLWKVLRQFESGDAGAGHNLNITARGTAQTNNGTEAGSGQIYYQSPILNIMGKEFSSMEDFQKTLSQIGINSGRTLIRVAFRNTTTPLYEAMENIRQYMNEVEPQEEKKEQAPAVPETSEQNPDSGAAEAISTDTITEASNPQSQPPVVSEQPSASTSEHIATDNSSLHSQPRDFLAPVHVYSAPTSTVPAAVLKEDPDTVYEPTIAHAKLHQARLQASTQNRRLKSDQELAAEREAETARLAAVTSLTIKVRFPDQDSAVWNLPADATGATLYAAVRGAMAHPEQKFKLVLPGGAGVIADSEGRQSDSLVKGYRLRGSVLLNLTWDDSASEAARQDPFLKATVASQAEEIPIPDVTAEDKEDEKEDAKPAPSSSKPSGSGKDGGSSGKVPKWLKLGKK